MYSMLDYEQFYVYQWPQPVWFDTFTVLGRYLILFLYTLAVYTIPQYLVVATASDQPSLNPPRPHPYNYFSQMSDRSDSVMEESKR